MINPKLFWNTLYIIGPSLANFRFGGKKSAMCCALVDLRVTLCFPGQTAQGSCVDKAFILNRDELINVTSRKSRSYSGVLCMFIQHLLRFLQPHWSILNHMTCDKSNVEQHHSPGMQFLLINLHHCTLTSLTMYKVYIEVSDFTMQWNKRSNETALRCHNKHKA